MEIGIWVWSVLSMRLKREQPLDVWVLSEVAQAKVTCDFISSQIGQLVGQVMWTEKE